jgi:hypothetical protein
MTQIIRNVGANRVTYVNYIGIKYCGVLARRMRVRRG